MPNSNIFDIKSHNKREKRMRVECREHTAWIKQVRKLIQSPTIEDSQGNGELPRGMERR